MCPRRCVARNQIRPTEVRYTDGAPSSQLPSPPRRGFVESVLDQTQVSSFLVPLVVVLLVKPNLYLSLQLRLEPTVSLLSFPCYYELWQLGLLGVHACCPTLCAKSDEHNNITDS